jgi:hypothetical protein
MRGAAPEDLSTLDVVEERRVRVGLVVVVVVLVVVVLLADEVDEGGLSTGAFFNPVAVLLARVCVGAGAFLVAWVGPSAEVGLTAGRVLVVVVEGGYLVSLFAGSDVAGLVGCLTEVVLERPDAPFLNVLVVLLEVVALLVRGFTGRRLGEPWRSASVEFVAAAVVLVVEVVVEEEEAGLRIDFERCNVDILTPLTLCLEMKWEWDVLVNVYCDDGGKGRLGYGYR